ncbi:MAG TPA: hypothetical protein VH595_07070 [Verrucomicrobiae bacterium]|jgi:hypothetical protein|nr:hypothetical protein [Verrucomicrobiae bacterium]
MPQFKIPSSEYRVYKSIALLDDKSFENLLNGIEEIGPTVTHLNFASALHERVPSVSIEITRQLVRTVSSLHRLMSSIGRTAQGLTSDVRLTIESEEPRGFPMDKLSVFIDRLSQLLNVGGGMGLIGKTINVMSDQDKVFCGVRILSDMRPVFSESATSIDAGVIIHTLNLYYHHEGRHHDIYVAMNGDDLQKLKKSIERAEKKHALLKSYIQKSGVRFFEDKE